MDYVGEFHGVEKDGQLFQLVYHHPTYQPIPQTQSPNSFDEAASYDHPFQLRFLCPTARNGKEHSNSSSYPLNSSPEYVDSTTRTQQEEDHLVLPLFWCNNKEFDVDGGCDICSGSKFGPDYYLCIYGNNMYHKECVQSPLKIKHPFHPEHYLQLYYHCPTHDIECLCCGRGARDLVYYCTICEVVMHTTCAMKSIPFVVDQPKRHDHHLTYFPRQASLTCNVWGLVRNIYPPTYVCLRCNFVTHKDCMYFPHIIKISRHHHRISYFYSLRSGEWSCGIFRQSIDNYYGAYACEKCSDYVVHTRCALGKDVWDGKELENVPEEDDITKDAGLFDMISEEVILHFLHDHHLLLEVNIFYDENKICQACALPVYEGDLYSCMTCNFILHETCENNPSRIQDALHPYPLILKAVSRYDSGAFNCNACDRICGGFVYECPIGE